MKSRPQNLGNHRRNSSAIKLTLLYAIWGGLWIIGSSWLLHLFVRDGALHAHLEIAKGWIFIFVTSGLLWLVLRRRFEELECSHGLLRESETRWKHALEGASQAVWDWNPQTRQVLYSPEWKAMLGFAPYEIGDTLEEWETRVHPEDLAATKEQLQLHLVGQSPGYVSEHRLRCKDGSYKWILDRGKVTSRAPDGKPLRMVGTHSDIHRRKQAEEALAASEQRFRALVEKSHEGICTLGADFKILYRSPSLKSLQGFEPAERQDHDVLELVHPEDRAATRAAFEEVRGRAGESKIITARLQHRDGAWRWQEATVTNYLTDPAVGALVLNFRDVTERKQLEVELRHWADAFQYCAHGIAMAAGNSTQVQVCNPALARMLGSTIEEITEAEILSLYPPSEHARVVAAIGESDRVGRAVYEARKVRRDGSTFLAEVQVVSVRDESGAVSHRIASVADITERRQTEQAMRESQRRLQLFFNRSLDGYYFTQLDEPQPWDEATDKDKVLGYIATHQRITEVNDALLSQYGMTRASLIGQLVGRFFEHNMENGRQLRRKLWDEGRLHAETMERKQDGSPIWIEGDYVCLYDEQKRITGTFGIQRDITERKRKERELARTHQRSATLAHLGRELAEAVEPRAAALAILASARSLLDWDCAWLRAWEESTQQWQDLAVFDLIDGDRREVLTSPLAMADLSPVIRRALTEAQLVLRESEQQGEQLLTTFGNGRRSLSLMFAPMRVAGRLAGVLSVQSYRCNAFEASDLELLQALADHCAGALERIRTSNALGESEARYRALFDQAPEGIMLLSSDGQIMGLNTAFARMHGYDRPEEMGALQLANLDTPASAPHAAERVRRTAAGEMLSFEVEHFRKDGSTFPLSVTASRVDLGGKWYLQTFHRDISEHRRSEQLRTLSAEVLQILNSPQALPDATKRILEAIKRDTGIEAVGIRLRQGKDFPYAESAGFSASFLEAENFLAVRTPDGKFCVDQTGAVQLECTCGLVLTGKTDPANQLFTAHGSAWTNDSNSLLEIPAAEDPRLHPRNRCIHEGYQSVALIPIRVEQEVIGLLQLNDRRKGCFTLKMIEYLEGLASSFGVALQRLKEEHALRQSETTYRGILNSLNEAVYVMDEAGTFVDVNLGAERMYRYQRAELIGRNPAWVSAAGKNDLPRVMEQFALALAGTPQSFEFWGLGKDGHVFPKEVHLYPGQYFGKRSVIAIAQDITERKRAEETLRQRSRELKTLNDIGQALSHLTEPVEVLERIVVEIGKIMDNRNLFIALPDWSRDQMCFPIYTIRGEREPRKDRAIGKGITEYVLRTKAPFLVRGDMVATLRELAIDQIGQPSCSLVAVPLRAGDEAIGVLALQDYDREDAFDEHHVELLTTIAAQASSALENSRLYSASQRELEDRKRAEMALRESENRFRGIIEKAPDGVVLCSPEGHLTYASPAACRTFGFTPEMVREIDPAAYTHPDDLPFVLANLEEVLRKPAQIPTMQYRFRHTNGNWLWIESTFTNLVGTAGVDAIVINFRNINDRKLAEVALHESELRRSLALEAARMGTWDWDVVGGRTVWCKTHEALWGYAPGTFPGTLEGYTSRIHPDDLPVVLRAGELARQTGTAYQSEFRIVWPDGSVHWVSNHGKHLFNDRGELIRMVGVVFEITERKRAEEALRESEERFRVVVEGAELGVFLSTDWKFDYLNPAALRLFGAKSPAQILGQPVWPRIHPDFHEIIRGRAHQLTQGERVGAPALREVYLRCDGSPVDVEVSAFSAIYRGKPAAVVLVQDITERLRAEAALHESEDRYRLLVEESPEAIGIYQDDCLVFINSAGLRLLGAQSKEVVLGCTSKQIIFTDDQPAAVERIRRRLSGDTTAYPAEVRYVRMDGSTIPVEVSAAPVQYAGRNAVQFIARDITERKQREQENELYLRTLELLANEAPLPEVLANMVTQLESGRDWIGSIMLVDETGTRLDCGAAPRLPAFYVEAVNNLPIAVGRGSCGTAAATKEMVVVEDVLTHPYWTDYRELAQRAGLRACWSVPILSAHGEVLGALAVYHSEPAVPTEQDLEAIRGVKDLAGVAIGKLKAEQNLKEREATFSAIVNQAADAIAVVDANNGRFVEFNTMAHLSLGYTRAEFAGFGVRDIQAEHSPELIHRNNNSVQLQGGICFETKHRHRDGSLRDVRVSLQQLPNRNRHYVAAVWTDITDRRRLEEQLRQAQKLEAIGQLAGGVAHDFNNILAAIMMHIGLLQMSPSMDADTLAALRDLDVEARRAATLTRQLLMFSRRSVLAVKSLDLNELVANMLKMLARLIGENIALRFDRGTTLPFVEADAGMVEQVLLNLVVNARDAIQRDGRVTICTSASDYSPIDLAQNPSRHAGRFVCLAVADTGMGMDEATQSRIFEPFFTTKEAGKGTGLGLATVHGIVAQHKGWVEVESRLGQGSTFRVFLPASPQTESVPEREAPKETLRRGHETILLVEDDPKVRTAVGMGLRALGYRIHEVANGQEAMAFWREKALEVDLLFTDMVMPEGITGLELIERLQELKPGLKAIISSGYSSEMVHAGIPKDSGVIYLPKPYDTTQLSQAVRQCLDQPT